MGSVCVGVCLGCMESVCRACAVECTAFSDLPWGGRRVNLGSIHQPWVFPAFQPQLGELRSSPTSVHTFWANASGLVSTWPPQLSPRSGALTGGLDGGMGCGRQATVVRSKGSSWAWSESLLSPDLASTGESGGAEELCPGPAPSRTSASEPDELGEARPVLKSSPTRSSRGGRLGGHFVSLRRRELALGLGPLNRNPVLQGGVGDLGGSLWGLRTSPL